MIWDRFVQVEHLLVTADGDDMARVAPTGSGLGDAVAQIGVCLAALRRARPTVLVSAARVVAALSDGWLLGTGRLRSLVPGFQHEHTSLNLVM
jgi:cytochrome b